METGRLRADGARKKVAEREGRKHCFNWNAALDPIELVDTAKVLFVPVGTALLGVAFLGIAVSLCDTGAGCALAPFALLNAGMHFAASLLSLKGARGYLKYRWEEITQCQEDR